VSNLAAGLVVAVVVAQAEPQLPPTFPCIATARAGKLYLFISTGGQHGPNVDIEWGPERSRLTAETTAADHRELSGPDAGAIWNRTSVDAERARREALAMLVPLDSKAPSPTLGRVIVIVQCDSHTEYREAVMDPRPSYESCSKPARGESYVGCIRRVFHLRQVIRQEEGVGALIDLVRRTAAAHAPPR
jgi:hypothetical protein